MGAGATWLAHLAEAAPQYHAPLLGIVAGLFYLSNKVKYVKIIALK